MLAEWTGLEPATPGVTGRYSNQLNYHSVRSIESAEKRHYTELSVPVKKLFSKFPERLVGAERVELPTIAV